MNQVQFRISLLTLILALCLLSCGTESGSPEQRIRMLNEAAKTATQDRDAGALKSLIAADYRDDRGNDKNSLVRLIQFYFLGHKSIYVYTITESIDITGPAQATAVVLVAMAGQPVNSAQELFDIRADMLRFDVSYVFQDDEWQVGNVEWQRAGVDDFL